MPKKKFVEPSICCDCEEEDCFGCGIVEPFDGEEAETLERGEEREQKP